MLRTLVLVVSTFVGLGFAAWERIALDSERSRRPASAPGPGAGTPENGGAQRTAVRREKREHEPPTRFRKPEDPGPTIAMTIVLFGAAYVCGTVLYWLTGLRQDEAELQHSFRWGLVILSCVGGAYLSYSGFEAARQGGPFRPSFVLGPVMLLQEIVSSAWSLYRTVCGPTPEPEPEPEPEPAEESS